MKMDNAALIHACQKGEKEALSLFYTRFAPRMLSLIRRYVDDKSDAQDILHDGFIIAFTRLDSLQNPERVEYWLATIMRNLSLKFLKSRDISQIIHELPEIEDPEAVENVLDFDVLLSLIDRLPAGYKNVFRLAVFENKSHKEIAEILGIAPNSSSSQLFRAKIQLRQLINGYKGRVGILSLLLALSIPGMFYLLKESAKEMMDLSDLSSTSSAVSSSLRLPDNALPVVAKPGSQPAFASSNSRKGPKKNRYARGKVSVGNQNVSGYDEETAVDSDNPSTADSEENRGSSPDKKDSIRNRNEEPYWLADNGDPLPVRNLEASRKWNLSFSVAPGANNLGSIGQSSDLSSSTGKPEEPNIPSIPDDPGNDWDGNVGFGEPDGSDKDPNDDSGHDEGKPSDSMPTRGAGMRRALPRSMNGVPHHNHLPLSFMLSAQRNLTSWLGVETGLTYTYLHTTFEDGNTKPECYWHYIGIPLKFNLTLHTTSKFRFYSSLGGSFSLPVYSFIDYGSSYANTETFTSYPVWAIGAGIGVSFNLSRHLDLYLEPTVQYRFHHKHDVPNAWTDEPWGFSFPIGLRFKW